MDTFTTTTPSGPCGALRERRRPLPPVSARDEFSDLSEQMRAFGAREPDIMATIAFMRERRRHITH